jgi:hypothetical protein
MEKRISYQQFQSVKSVAKAIDPIVRKKEAMERKLMEMKEEYMGYKAQIDALEAGIVNIIGFHVTDLVKKVIEPTGKTDANGKALMQTKYLPTGMVTYDEQHKQYVITTPDPANDVLEETVKDPEGELNQEAAGETNSDSIFD